MQTSAIGQTADTVGSTPAPALSGLKSEDFFRILVSELKQQDPFEPAKTADMISQVSQIRTIELSGQLTKTLEQMTRQQRVAGAGELIGKYVMAIVSAPDGSQVAVEGLVTGIRFDSDGSAVLELDTGESVRADDVTWVTTLEALEALGTPDATTAQAAADADEAKSDLTARRVAGDEQAPSWLSVDAALRV
jgi:flagellar basal-body rod modification protein FlgD